MEGGGGQHNDAALVRRTTDPIRLWGPAGTPGRRRIPAHPGIAEPARHCPFLSGRSRGKL